MIIRSNDIRINCIRFRNFPVVNCYYKTCAFTRYCGDTFKVRRKIALFTAGNIKNGWQMTVLIKTDKIWTFYPYYTLGPLALTFLRLLIQMTLNLLIQQKIKSTQVIQEAKLMPTNPRNAFRSHSRPPNIVPFHMLGILSPCAIVTLSLSL